MSNATTGINLALTDNEARALLFGAESILEDIDEYAIDAAAYQRALDKLRNLVRKSSP